MHSAFSSGCSDRCACTGAPCACDHAMISGTWSGATARTEWMAAPRRAGGAAMPSESEAEAENRPRPARGGAVAEAQLHSCQRHRIAAGGESAGEVAGIKQGDPHARGSGGVDQAQPELVRIAVSPSSRSMMEVMELSDAGDPGERHLGVDGAGEGE